VARSSTTVTAFFDSRHISIKVDLDRLSDTLG